MTDEPQPEPYATVTATTEKGLISFSVSNPPTAEDLDRWRRLAEFIPDATWTAGGLVRRPPPAPPPAAE